MRANSINVSFVNVEDTLDARIISTQALRFQGASLMEIHEDSSQTQQGAPSTLLFTGHDGNLARLRYIADGTEDWDAATVGQVNAVISNIDEVLDEIIELQEGFLYPDGDEVSY